MSRSSRSLSIGAALGVLAGAAFALSALRAPSGYAAAYDWGGALSVALAILVIAAFLVSSHRLRPYGYGALLCSASLVLAFWVFLDAGTRAGARAWWGDEREAIPATQPR